MRDTEFYTKLLSLPSPWEVSSVELDTEKEEVYIWIRYGSGQACCPECGKAYPIYDHRKPRRWRHLDTCQMKTWLVCSVPRVSCPEHGVITIATPWANPQSRMTRMFERLAIDMLKAFKNQTKVAKLLRISFDQIHHIMHQSVKRGLARRSKQHSPRRLGMDEKSFQKGHRYSTILSDLDTGCVIDLCEHRDEDSVTELIHKNLTQEQKDNIEAVSLDMWKPFINAVKTCFPNADIVHDRFHLAKYLNEAVDTTRRQEVQQLNEQDQKNCLKNTRYIFLTNPENWSEAYFKRFEEIKTMNLKTAEAWQIKENFKPFFQLASVEQGNNYFLEWYEDAIKTDIKPIQKVANMFKKHIQGILNYLKHRITNALLESINSIIQQIKHIARGYKSFENFRIAVLFHLGKLNL
ncbi:ISL3 family transposase [Thermodesulfatator atlanticus]